MNAMPFLLLALNAALLKTVATFTFVAIFLGVVIWLLMSRPGKYQKTKQIPLHDERVMEPREGAADEAGQNDDDDVNKRSETSNGQ
jgi:cbb3-type cytochrome oxidase subunit 3